MDFDISRKNFLKWAGFLTAGFALPGAIKAEVLTPKGAPLPRLGSEEYKPTLCKLCPALCMLQIRVVNGKPVGVSGMPSHPVSQGGHCPKGGAILQDLYHPDRLRHPMRRKGPRGSNQWERASWDEAHNIVYEKLSGLLKKNRPEALAILAAPIRDIRHEIQKRFARVFGTPNFWEWNWPASEPPLDAFERIHGSSEGLLYDLANANLIVSFGWDWLQSFYSPVEAQRAYGLLRRGRLERRARMIQIEPRLSTTAAKADEWISIKPGTEGALALGAAHVLIRDGLYDKPFVNRWTSGFDEFKRRVLTDYPPGRVSEITGVRESRILEIAHELVSIKPALAITYRGSLFNQLAVHSLNALVGSVGVQRGVLSTEAEKYQFVLPPAAIPKPKASRIAALHNIPEAVLDAKKSPIELLWLERVNPVFLSPQPEQWKKTLEKVPFIVSFSSYLDESSQLSDIVLPPHHTLEAWQYGFSPTLQGDGVISFAPSVISPLYETGDHGDFILGLARSLEGSIAEVLPWRTFVESLEKAVKRARAEGAMRKGTWLEYKAIGAKLRSTVKTKSGKLEFPIKELAMENGKPGESNYPLQLLVHFPLAFSFGEGAHLPYLHSLAGAHLGEQWETWVEIHPFTAGKLGILDGRKVWVESAFGKIQAKARHYEGIGRDSVSVPFGLGHTAMGRYAEGIGANPAELLHREVDSSGQPLWQNTWVRVYAA